jgi:hypothetical protein
LYNDTVQVHRCRVVHSPFDVIYVAKVANMK